MMNLKYMIILIAAFGLVFMSCEDDKTTELITDLNVKEVSNAPTIDGNGTDAVWKDADALELVLGQTADYSNAFGKVDLTLKAVRVSSTLYILAEWMDPSASKSVDKKQWNYDSGAWKQSGNEDRIFFMFDAGDNGTEGANCATMCHVAEGAMYTTGGGHVDVWHGKTARTFPVGRTDDKWWDGTGRNSDAKTVGAYSNNKQTLADGSTVPLYSGPITDDHFIIITEGGTADDLTLFDTTSTTGTFPGYILNMNRDGSRFADIETQATFSGGKWTVELKRALNTGNSDDVAFTVGKDYQMTVAITDNSGGDHSGAVPFFIKF
jgi:hypothetical protein